MEEIKRYIIGIVLFVMIIVGGVSMLSELNKSDSTFTDSEDFTQFNKSFDKLNDITEETDKLKSGVVGSKPDLGFFGVLNSLISSVWQTEKLTSNSLNFMDSVFNAGQTIFGVPIWIGSLIISIISVIIVFAIYKAIFKVQ